MWPKIVLNEDAGNGSIPLYNQLKGKSNLAIINNVSSGFDSL